MQILGQALEHAADVGTIRRAILVDNFAKHQHLARAKIVSGSPVEGAPVDTEAQIALALRGEAANRRTVEGKIVPALDEEFFVVVEHVQAAFEVAEEDRYGLYARFVG